MKEKFGGFYRPTSSEFKKLWETCVFILDANVILGLYRYPESARKDLVKILNSIKDRTWIPYHAALEFERNRLNVIAEQQNRFTEVRKVLADVKNKLETGFSNLQLNKRHSSIDPTDFLEDVKRIFANFNAHLLTAERGHTEVSDEDKIREEISSLYAGKIGDPPKDQKELDGVYLEGESRYRNRIPPGYMDQDKKKGADSDLFSYGGLAFRKVYGDWILWKEIIEHAKNAKLKSVIFVTDDYKEDWWMQVESKGRKTIGPRPELIDEIKRVAGVEIFYMYNSEQFMKLADQYLDVQVRAESISQVRESRLKRQHGIALSREFSLLEPMTKWIEKRYPNLKRLTYSSTGTDIEVVVDPATRVGFEVKHMNKITMGEIGELSGNTISAKNLLFTELNLAIDTTPVFLQSTVGRARVQDIQRLFYDEGRRFGYDFVYVGYTAYSGEGAIYTPIWRCGSRGVEYLSDSTNSSA